MTNNVIASFETRGCKVVCVECGTSGRYEVRSEYTGNRPCSDTLIFKARIVHCDRDKAFDDFMRVKAIATVLAEMTQANA